MITTYKYNNNLLIEETIRYKKAIYTKQVDNGSRPLNRVEYQYDANKNKVNETHSYIYVLNDREVELDLAMLEHDVDTFILKKISYSYNDTGIISIENDYRERRTDTIIITHKRNSKGQIIETKEKGILYDMQANYYYGYFPDKRIVRGTKSTNGFTYQFVEDSYTYK